MAERLAALLGQPVLFADDAIGEPAAAVAAKLGDGDVALLENLRFHAGEEKNDPEFARALAAPATAYVDDAFGSAHRAHASVIGVLPYLARKAAGRLMVREVEALSKLLGEPPRPFAAILGGAKIEGKIDTLENLLPRLDILMVGGGMANTFLAAQGLDLKASLVERDRLDLARTILERAAAQGTEVLLPTDLVTTDSFDNPQIVQTVAGGGDPARLPRRRRRPADPQGVRRRRRPRPDAVLERSARRLREAAVRRGDARRGARPRRLPRLHPDRRRRDGRRGAPGRGRRARSATSRPAAARRSSSSPARPCPASRRSRGPRWPAIRTPDDPRSAFRPGAAACRWWPATGR